MCLSSKLDVKFLEVGRCSSHLEPHCLFLCIVSVFDARAPTVLAGHGPSIQGLHWAA